MKTEIRIRCSGRGKPWHGTNREHTYHEASREKAEESVETMNAEARTPIRLECAPWIIEEREITDWTLSEAGFQDRLGGTK